MTTIVPAAMLAADVATQSELNAGLATKLTGDVVQTVHFQTGEVATGTTLIPIDDTIPQIAEGTQFLTASITPTSATNILEIEVTMNLAASAAASLCAAVFVAGAANAVASTTRYATGNNQVTSMTLKHRQVAGSTSALAVTVRAGPTSAATVTMNGLGGVRYFGGTWISSLTLTEIKA